MADEVDPRILELCEQVTAKRPRTVIDHILKHGQVTTAELRDLYGYDHPPRAARDVREVHHEGTVRRVLQRLREPNDRLARPRQTARCPGNSSHRRVGTSAKSSDDATTDNKADLSAIQARMSYSIKV